MSPRVYWLLLWIVMAAPCRAELRLDWPLGGRCGVDWVSSHFVDLDPGPGVRDWAGHEGPVAHTYDGHRGTDIDIPSFRAMDRGVPVMAAANGRVIELEQEHFDRNIHGEDLPWNFVAIEHDGGLVTIYSHLRWHSVQVSVGDWVESGDVLGMVGSSGRSHMPHLHFEVLAPDGETAIDPYQQDLWRVQPAHDAPLGLMDAMLRAGGMSRIDELIDPVPNTRSLWAGEIMGIGVSLAGADIADLIDISVLGPDGTRVEELGRRFEKKWLHSFWYWNFRVGHQLGEWHVRITLNGQPAWTGSFMVRPRQATPSQRLITALPVDQFQQAYASAIAEGYMPVWIDGCTWPEGARLSAGLTRADGGSWAAHMDLTGPMLDGLIRRYALSGYQLEQAESYATAEGVRYAVLFRGGSTLWMCSRGLTIEQQDEESYRLGMQGFVPVVVSGVHIDGSLWLTTTYHKLARPAELRLALTRQRLTEAIMELNFEGYDPVALDGVAANGSTLFVGCWQQSSPGDQIIRHALSADELEALALEAWVEGYTLDWLTAYPDSGEIRFSVRWVR